MELHQYIMTMIEELPHVLMVKALDQVNCRVQTKVPAQESSLLGLMLSENKTVESAARRMGEEARL